MLSLGCHLSKHYKLAEDSPQNLMEFHPVPAQALQKTMKTDKEPPWCLALRIRDGYLEHRSICTNVYLMSRTRVNTRQTHSSSVPSPSEVLLATALYAFASGVARICKATCTVML